jgi:hypothetical protein
MMSAFQVMAKSAAAALLAVTNANWLLGYIAADHCLHIIYRIARRDIVDYNPMPPAVSYVWSPVLRVIMKTISDFTGAPLFDAPTMLGGAYWLFSLVASQAGVFVCVHVYNERAPGMDIGKIDAAPLWAGAGGLAAGWLITFTYVRERRERKRRAGGGGTANFATSPFFFARRYFAFRIAVPEYRHTLWSWTTGAQYVCDRFLKGKDDEAKFHVFGINLLMWERTIGDEVKAWVAENWTRWKEEKPAWFDEALVPDQFVPATELEVLGYDRKRRGSASGSVRESFLGVSVGGAE